MSKKSVWNATNGLAILATARKGVTAADAAWRADRAAGNGRVDEARAETTNSAVGHEAGAEPSDRYDANAGAVAQAKPVMPDEFARSGSAD